MNLTGGQKRIVIVGTSCSGKTSLAEQLAEKLRIEHLHLDMLYWRENWQKTPDDVFRAFMADEIKKDEWIIDGNYRITFDMVFPRATVIIWLDLPLPVIFWRGLKRTIRRIIKKEEVCNGNQETFRQSFLSRDSILLWILTSHGYLKRRYEPLFVGEHHDGLQLVRLKRKRDIERFLGGLEVL